jgi:hippurate hydrolase
MHNMPGIPLGHFALRKGAFMAASGRWSVTFRGAGGHGGAAPHLSNDLAVVQAFFVQALQTIVSRNAPPLESIVVSVGHISAGRPEALNVLPSELLIGGTMRAFTGPMQDLLERRIRELADLAAATQGATAEVELRWGTLPLVNHGRETEVMAAAARILGGDAAVDTEAEAVTGGEDFSFMLDAKPGAFVFLGNGTAPDGEVHGLHTPRYDFNDAALPHGVAFWVGLVQQELG